MSDDLSKRAIGLKHWWTERPDQQFSIVGEMVDEKFFSSFHNDAELWVWGPSQSAYDARSAAVNLTVRFICVSSEKYTSGHHGRRQ